MDEVIIYNEEKIASLIYIIRGKRVMTDSDLSKIYNVETRTLNQAVSRNKELANKIAKMEKQYDKQFKVVFSAIRQLMEEPKKPDRKPLGYQYKNRK